VAVQCDIRYAGPAARLGHIEVGFGLPPGAGGVQFLVKLIGRTRALEYILSARSVDAVTAAAIGWVNLAFGSAQELRSEVDALATRIATFSKQRLAAIKARVSVQKQSDADLQGNNDLFFELVGTEVTQKAGDRFLVLGGNESDDRLKRGLPDDVAEVVGSGRELWGGFGSLRSLWVAFVRECWRQRMGFAYPFDWQRELASR